MIKLKCYIFSGSGKTHTIEGELDEEKGVIPRTAEMVFQRYVYNIHEEKCIRVKT